MCKVLCAILSFELSVNLISLINTSASLVAMRSSTLAFLLESYESVSSRIAAKDDLSPATEDDLSTAAEDDSSISTAPLPCSHRPTSTFYAVLQCLKIVIFYTAGIYSGED